MAVGPEENALGGSPEPWITRLYSFLTGVVGAVAGIIPHVLHHIGPIAGTALLTGTEGSFLFGSLGLLLSRPMLLRLKSRFKSWLAPGVALVLFALMFAVSSLWIGPAIRGDDSSSVTEPVDPHHTSFISEPNPKETRL